MTDIEIPLEGDRSRRYRFFEMLPGLITWTILLMPFVLSWLAPNVIVVFIIGYLILWFIKSLLIDFRALQGHRLIGAHTRLDWGELNIELEAGEVTETLTRRPKWHYDNLLRLQIQPAAVKPSELIHVVMIAAYNEGRRVLEPTIKSLLDSDFDMKRVVLVLAYEGRDGAQSETASLELVKEYKHHFMDALAIKHPLTPNEVKGKGGNISYAGRLVKTYLEEKGIEPLKVVVTTLDSDNRPHKRYLAALTYLYCVCPDPIHISFQPVPMYTNNIWDAPAPMRVVATGNSFWNMVLSLRPHMLRNFSSHAQGMQSLIDTDFWSARTIVEDGHQFWRTYFRYDGNHEVYPIYVPIYQDAVFADGYWKTLKAQFVQLRRWAWGASDVAYVVEMGFFRKNHVNRWDLLAKTARLLEGHVTWAVAPLLITFSAFIPVFIKPDSFAANQLPLIASRLETIALIGIFAALFISLKTLPPKPIRYKRRRSLFMVIQWFYLPVTTILYNSLSAIYSQTRLILGRYLGNFDVTEKAVASDKPKH